MFANWQCALSEMSNMCTILEALNYSWSHYDSGKFVVLLKANYCLHPPACTRLRCLWVFIISLALLCIDVKQKNVSFSRSIHTHLPQSEMKLRMSLLLRYFTLNSEKQDLPRVYSGMRVMIHCTTQEIELSICRCFRCDNTWSAS